MRIRGLWSTTLSSTLRRWGFAPSSRLECPALSAAILDAGTFSALNAACRASMPCMDPEATQPSGVMTAPMETPPGNRSRRSSCPICTKSIPPSGELPISRERSTIRRTASSSENTPAIVAATYSPAECPITMEGIIPRSISRRAKAYSTANRAKVPVSVSASASALEMAASTSMPVSLSKVAHIRSKGCLKAGRVSRRFTAIP